MRINKTVTCVKNPQTHTMSECVYKHATPNSTINHLLDQMNVLILLLMFVSILFVIFCLNNVFYLCVVIIVTFSIICNFFFLDLVAELAL